ncbi:MAG: endo alpha-1,4 polygalactosaminidase [Fibrobacteria bacterium]|nr:endo alpha-1,4 polygalactosaminidase [Fibrobacteria bacterium]
MQTKNNMEVEKWACYYGEDSSSLARLEEYDLVVMEPDHGFTPPENTRTLYVGYVSLGEAEKFRWYWKEIEGRDFILWENENWKDDYLIDIRSSEWQDFLVKRIIPKIIAKGYEGLFFDTIDTPLFLEEKDSEKFAGSAVALGTLIKRIRETFPDLVLVSNNGLRAVTHIGAYVDVFVLESMFTTYDFESKNYGKADSSWRKKRIGQINANKELFAGKPVLVIDYADPGDKALKDWSGAECKKRGFVPYHTTIDLQKLF